MSKLAWYVVIMLAIDILLYIARFGVAIIKSAKQDASQGLFIWRQDVQKRQGCISG